VDTGALVCIHVSMRTNSNQIPSSHGQQTVSLVEKCGMEVL
jgi:hypothetical protein